MFTGGIGENAAEIRRRVCERFEWAGLVLDHERNELRLALTRAMCAPGSLSNRFARDVGRATSYFIKDGDLFLELPVDSGTLRSRRQA